jgi:hypothetical protein
MEGKALMRRIYSELPSGLMRWLEAAVPGEPSRLQQQWFIHFSDGGQDYEVETEWRDVPIVRLP